MPESKHRRGGKLRPREHQTHAPEKKPSPSPTWVPATGSALLVVGLVIILVGYLPAVNDSAFMRSLPLLGANWSLVLGFVVMGVGFGFLSRWR